MSATREGGERGNASPFPGVGRRERDESELVLRTERTASCMFDDLFESFASGVAEDLLGDIIGPSSNDFSRARHRTNWYVDAFFCNACYGKARGKRRLLAWYVFTCPICDARWAVKRKEPKVRRELRDGRPVL